MPNGGLAEGKGGLAEISGTPRSGRDSGYFLDTHTPMVERGAMSAPELSVILPVHNEARGIAQVVSEIHSVIASRLPTEIICTEDGSHDDTPLILRKLATKIPLKVLSSPQRKGYAGAIVDGVGLASSGHILFVDSDGQHAPSDFWDLYEARDLAPIVSGWRCERADPLIRRGLSFVFTSVTRAVFHLPPLRDVTAPFRLVETTAAKRLTKQCRYMRESFWTEFTIHAVARGYDIIEVPIVHRTRADGSSRVYRFGAMPEIAYRQMVGLAKTWADLRTENRNAGNVA